MANCGRLSEALGLRTRRATLPLLLLAGIAATAHAGTVSYDTTGSTLSCSSYFDPAHPLCTQNTPTSVTVGGMTFTYYPGSGSNVSTPSIIDLGKIVGTGAGSIAEFDAPSTILLTIKVNSTPPGASTALPPWNVQGGIYTDSSTASLVNLWTGSTLTTTTFGKLPGAIVSGGTQSFTYQILNTTQALVAPAAGNPMGQTLIQGAVSEISGLTLLPPTITHSFGAASVPMIAPTKVTFRIANPNSTALTNLYFSDQLPFQWYPASPSNLTSDCGGVAGLNGLGFSYTIYLNHGSLAGGASCTISADIGAGWAPGQRVNTADVSDLIAGRGNTSVAIVTVLATAPSLTQSFADAVLTFHPATQLSFTVSNPSPSIPVTLSGAGFTDTLPAGMVVSTPNHLTGGCYDGVITASPGSNAIGLSGTTLAPGASCTFSVSVSAAAGNGTLVSTATPTAKESGPGAAASATIVNNQYMVLLRRFW
jgi:hypothetical protein